MKSCTGSEQSDVPVFFVCLKRTTIKCCTGAEQGDVLVFVVFEEHIM